MTKCSLIVDIIIGELTVVESSAVVRHVKNPLCPIVAVQISKGPLLYIPFLTPESITSHLQYISSGHQFLPLEVEESYLNGGKFIFHRGKSCLYTVPQESLQKGNCNNQDSSFNDRVVLSQNVVVIVMNALMYPPAFFGKCTLQLQPHGEIDGHMAGKVELRNHIGNLVGYMSMSVSLRYLGEDVVLHSVRHNDATDQDLLNTNLDNFVSVGKENISPTREEKCFNENFKSAKHIDVMTDENPNKFFGRNAYGLEHSFKCSRPLDSKEMVVQRESSEEIALRIAALVRSEASPEEQVNAENTNVASCRKSDICIQPDPILYFGHDSESEKMWNEKMTDFGGFFEVVGNFDHCFKDLEQESNSYSGSVESYRSETSLQTSVESGSKDKGKNNDKLSSISGSVNKSSYKNPERKIDNKCQALKMPKGWLRSTPVASCNMQNKAVYPRLTRTSLLRRAKLDPQLAHQLHAEVRYQVKQKLQSLEKNFKDELTDIKKRKLLKNKGSLLVSVGCQASSGSSEKITPHYYDYHKDFAQQTVVHETSNQFTQINKEILKKTDSGENVKGGKYSKIEKDRTFDISDYNHSRLTEYDDDFEISTISKPDPDSVTEFPVLYQESSETGELSRSVSSKELSHPSISKGEPKKHVKEGKGTNTMRDIKMKVSNSKESSSVKSSVKSDSEFLDAKNQELVSNSMGSQKIAGIIEKKLIKKETSSSQGSISEIDIPDRSESDVHSSIATLSPEASEVSEASNLSKEVYQEIMKGRKADVLLRNGSQGFEKKCEMSSAEEAVSSAISSISVGKNLHLSASDDVKNVKARFVMTGETFSIGEIINSDNDLCDSPKEDVDTSKDLLKAKHIKNLYKERKIRELHKTYTKSEPSVLEKPSEVLSSPRNLPHSSVSVSAKDVDDEDSSTVSNISARIAALLMPKQLEVAALHTDSISSYMPSNVSDTLSSLSDLE
ncbi:uncharacterized protein LOC135212035 [Macrobrachium nipponense]|uniref:uncharacterized protein LOC135212035 n=1 Tax=Macrobrachium nipponense TaxID=159736 RepID=UPI0030C8C8D8